MLGPIDYIIVGFKGNKFDGSILNELTNATSNYIIRILDMVLVVKDQNGQVTEAEYADFSLDVQKAFGNINVDDKTPLLTTDDIVKVAEQLEPNTAAGILVIEHLWARNVKRAIVDANGFLMGYGRIQPDKVEAAVKELSHLTRV